MEYVLFAVIIWLVWRIVRPYITKFVHKPKNIVLEFTDEHQARSFVIKWRAFAEKGIGVVKRPEIEDYPDWILWAASWPYRVRDFCANRKMYGNEFVYAAKVVRRELNRGNIKRADNVIVQSPSGVIYPDNH